MIFNPPRGRVVVVLETASKATTTGGGVIKFFVKFI